MTGNKPLTLWAEEYGKALASSLENLGIRHRRYCDVERKLTVPQMLRSAFRHKLIDGDALMVLQYRRSPWTGKGVMPRRCRLLILTDSVTRRISICRISAAALKLMLTARLWLITFVKHISVTGGVAPNNDMASAYRETDWGARTLCTIFDHERGAPASW